MTVDERIADIEREAWLNEKLENYSSFMEQFVISDPSDEEDITAVRDIALFGMIQLRSTLDALRSARKDSERLDWLDEQHRGVEAGTMDDQDGEPTRKLFVVDGAGVDALMPTIREAIDRAQERYPTMPDDDANEPPAGSILPEQEKR